MKIHTYSILNTYANYFCQKRIFYLKATFEIFMLFMSYLTVEQLHNSFIRFYNAFIPVIQYFYAYYTIFLYLLYNVTYANYYILLQFILFQNEVPGPSFFK